MGRAIQGQWGMVGATEKEGVQLGVQFKGIGGEEAIQETWKGELSPSLLAYMAARQPVCEAGMQ